MREWWCNMQSRCRNTVAAVICVAVYMYGEETYILQVGHFEAPFCFFFTRMIGMLIILVFIGHRHVRDSCLCRVMLIILGFSGICMYICTYSHVYERNLSHCRIHVCLNVMYVCLSVTSLHV
jgi:hypothetical protein